MFGALNGYSTNQHPRSIPVFRPRFHSNHTARFSTYSIIFRASTLQNNSKTNVFMHLGGNSTRGMCSLYQIRDTIYYCNQSLMSNVSFMSDPSFDFALVSDGSRVVSVFFNGVLEQFSVSIPDSSAAASGLFLGRSGDGDIDSSLDGSLVYVMVLNRVVTGAEVQNLMKWSDNVHTIGAAWNHFSVGEWNSFTFTTRNQYEFNVIWRIPPSARPSFSRTLSFLLRLPYGVSSSRNVLLFSAAGAFSSRRFGIDWIYNNTESSQIHFYDAKDLISSNGSRCSIAGSGSMKIDAVVDPKVSGTGSVWSIYINHVLYTACSFHTSWPSAFYAGDVMTRQSNGLEVGMDVQFQHVRVLPYAASHYEVTRPRLLSIVLSNSTSRVAAAVVNGCCFVLGLPCSLLVSGATVSVSCIIQSAVEAVVEFLPHVQVAAAAFLHDGQVFVLEEVQSM